MIRVAVFASGTGSNAMNLIRFFKDHLSIEVAFVLCNNERAPIIKSARASGIEVVECSNQEAANGDYLQKICEERSIDWVVLAGYLRLVPASFISSYLDRIINLHPALLPKYGGKGMYGARVHEAVLANNENESGITLHYVNEAFDEGKVIAQFTCDIAENETVESLQAKIHSLEHSNLPSVVEKTIINHHVV